MPWLKLDDQIFLHPKIVAAGKDATLLHLSGLAYASSQLTDGFIPAAAVRVIAATVNVSGKGVDRLVDAGLWEVVDGGYAIHDFLQYNPSKEETMAKRTNLSEKRAEAGRKGANNRWHGDGKPIANVIANVRQTDNPHPLPHPRPQKEDTDTPPVAIATTPRGGKRATTRIPDDFEITPELRAVAVEAGVPSEQIEFETAKWRDHHAAKGDVVKDAAASWRTWMRNAPTFNRPRGSPNGSSNGNGASHFVTKQEQIDLNNRKAEEEFDAILNGSKRHGAADVSRPDQPPRGGVPGGHPGRDARRLLPGVSEDPR